MELFAKLAARSLIVTKPEPVPATRAIYASLLESQPATVLPSELTPLAPPIVMPLPRLTVMPASDSHWAIVSTVPDAQRRPVRAPAEPRPTPTITEPSPLTAIAMAPLT